MKKKAIVATALAICIVLTFGTTALAAPTPAEQILAELNYLQASYPNNRDLEHAVMQARAWLLNPGNADTVTQNQATAVVSQITAARATLGNTRMLRDLTKSQVDSILDNISAAARAMGFTFRVAADYSNLTLITPDGTTVSLNPDLFGSGENPIRQTGPGVDYSGIIAVGLFITLLAITALTALLAATKKRRAAAKATKA